MRRFIFLLFAGLAVAAGVSAWLTIKASSLTIRYSATEWEMPLALGLAVVAGLVALLFLASEGVAFVMRLPRRLRERRAAERHRRGLSALTRGMLAVAAGDSKAANRHAKEADALHAEPALTLLLGAQAAQLSGDDRAAEQRFTAMLASKETEFLGLRGLFIQASRRGDRSVALAYLRKASEERPGTPWVIHSLFDLYAAESRWVEAQEALVQAEKAKLVTGDIARRRRAVLLAAEAQAVLAKDRTRALTLAEEAIRLSPGLTPAACLAARLLGEDGRAWRAQTIVENAWGQAPHPDLAAIYGRLKPDESPRGRASRLTALAERNGAHLESLLLKAQQAIVLKDWTLARTVLGDLPEQTPTARVAALMAEIAQGLGNAGEMRHWLDRAVRAPREPQWSCENCRNQGPAWVPVCPSCGAFDSLTWRVRTETVVSEEPARTGLPAPVAAAPRPEPTPLRPTAERPPPARPAPRSEPRPATPPAAEGAPLIFVSPRPPDDPGPGAPEAEQPPIADRASAPRWSP